MNPRRANKLAERKRRIARRLRERHWTEQSRPMFKARAIRYELTDRTS